MVNMVKRFIFVLCLIVLIFLVGCGPSEQAEKTNQIVVEEEFLEIEGELSEFMLQIEDFSDDWKLSQQAPRSKSDISEKSLKLGWTDGYSRTFDSWEIITVEHFISRYSVDDIDKFRNHVNRDSGEGYTFEVLPNINLGDHSVSYKVTEEISLGELTLENEAYWIIFQKGNLHETLILSGSKLDYEFLKDLAKVAESKV